jgi:NADPH-dependent curcumin reductase CurA
MDFAAKDAEAERDLSAWTKGGQLKVHEDILDGLERAPRGLVGLLAGENRGKRMIRVGAEPQ